MSHFQSTFEAQTAQVRVRFGLGVRHDIASEIDRLGCKRALVLSTPPQSDAAMDVAGSINGHAAGVFTKAAPHTPIDVTQEALEHVQDIKADCVIAIGGGSTTGLGKAIALHTDLPQIVMPTTFAGSEATAILGQTENGVKTTVTDTRVQPEVVLYDAELVRTLPTNLAVTSGLNAMAHAAEALYAKNRNPLSTMLAVEGLKAFASALPKIVAAPDDDEARGEALYGAWLCGTVLGQVGMALHHKLCHTLGGSFDLPHAETHAIVLPHAIAFNEKAAADQLRPLADLFETDSPGQALFDFAQSLGAPTRLTDIGFDPDQAEKAAKIATANPYWNPRAFSADDLMPLLRNASLGHRPN